MLLICNSCRKDITIRKTSLLPFQTKNGKWGYIDSKSNIQVLKATYDLAYPFINNYAIVGFYEPFYNYGQDDNRKIDPKYDLTYPYLSSHTILYKKIAPKFGVIDTLGNFILPAVYDRIRFAINGYSCLYNHYYKYGFRYNNITLSDSSFQQIVPWKYKKITLSTNVNNVIVERHESNLSNNKGVYNCKSKQEIIPTQFDHITVFPSGFIEAEKNDSLSYYNQEGHCIIGMEKNQILKNDFSEGYAIVHSKDRCFEDGIIDTTGTLIVPIKYRNIQGIDTKTQIFWTYNYPQIKVYSFDSKLIFSGSCRQTVPIPGYSEGLLPYEKNGRWGFISSSGKISIPFIYDQIRGKGFKNGLCVVYKNGKEGVIDKSNRKIFAFSKKLKYRILNNSSISIENIKNHKEKLVNRQNHYSTGFMYDKIDYIGGGYYRVMSNNRWGLIDSSCKEILPIKCIKIDQAHKNIVPFTNADNTFGFLNLATHQITETPYTINKISDRYLSVGYTYILDDSLMVKNKLRYLNRSGNEYQVALPFNKAIP